MKTTPSMLIESPAFMDFATVEACKIVAESNGRQVKDAIIALKLGVPEVVGQVQKLILKAANEMAEELNAGANK